MEPLLLSLTLLRRRWPTLDLAGYPWKAAASAAAADRMEPEDGWAGVLVCADEDPQGAFALCRALRKRDVPMEPLLLVRGHEKVLAGGHVRSPLVASKSPRWWPREVPTPY